MYYYCQVASSGKDAMVAAAMVRKRKSGAARSSVLLNKKVRLEDNRIGTVVKSGHGFFTVEFDDGTPSVTRRKDSLVLINSAAGGGGRGSSPAASGRSSSSSSSSGSSSSTSSKPKSRSKSKGGFKSKKDKAAAAAAAAAAAKTSSSGGTEVDAEPRRARRQQSHGRAIDLRRKLTQVRLRAACLLLRLLLLLLLTRLHFFSLSRILPCSNTSTVRSTLAT